MSHNVVLNISDSVYNELMLTLSSFNNNEVEIISNEIYNDEYDEEYYMNLVPPELIVTSEEEIDKRLAIAEKSLSNGGGLNEEEAEKYLLKLCPWLNDDN